MFLLREVAGDYKPWPGNACIFILNILSRKISGEDNGILIVG